VAGALSVNGAAHYRCHGSTQHPINVLDFDSQANSLTRLAQGDVDINMEFWPLSSVDTVDAHLTNMDGNVLALSSPIGLVSRDGIYVSSWTLGASRTLSRGVALLSRPALPVYVCESIVCR
jgi:hypothetical protein